MSLVSGRWGRGRCDGAPPWRWVLAGLCGKGRWRLTLPPRWSSIRATWLAPLSVSGTGGFHVPALFTTPTGCSSGCWRKVGCPINHHVRIGHSRRFGPCRATLCGSGPAYGAALSATPVDGQEVPIAPLGGRSGRRFAFAGARGKCRYGIKKRTPRDARISVLDCNRGARLGMLVCSNRCVVNWAGRGTERLKQCNMSLLGWLRCWC